MRQSKTKADDQTIGSISGLGIWCVHCGRKCGTFARGAVQYQGKWLCSPNVSTEVNCYELVLNRGHSLDNCGLCWTEVEKPAPPKIRITETSIANF